MTKYEALEAMERGEKITHRYFTPEEWMTITTIEDRKVYLFEDGTIANMGHFWIGKGFEWENGYSIFKEPQNPE